MIIDIIVILILIVALIVGYQRGVIQPLMAEIFFFGTLLVLFRFHDQYTTLMARFHLNAVLAVFVALIVAVVLGAVGGAIASRIPPAVLRWTVVTLAIVVAVAYLVK